jgi:hypothetical protein
MLKIGISFIMQSHFCIENDQVQEHGMGRACSMHEDGVEKRTNAYRILMGKPEEKIPREIPRFRLVENIKTDLRGIG